MESKKKRGGSGTLLVLFGIIIFLSSLMVLLCLYYKDHSVVTKNIDVEIGNNEHVSGYSVEMSWGDKSWNNADKKSRQSYGTEYDGVLHNESGNNMEDWTITFNVPDGSIIDSSWNGTYSVEGSTVTVECVEYNRSLGDKDPIDQTFGFIMYTEGPITIDTFHLTAKETEVHLIYQHIPFWVLSLLIFTVVIIFITNIFTAAHYKRLAEKYDFMHEVTDQALRTFARIIDTKDDYTFGHSYRVAVYSRQLAKNLGLPEEEQERIYYIGLLHDIGKIGIPDTILKKAGTLDDAEHEKIRTHAPLGGNILSDFTAIPGLQDGARYHHERYDGTGYCAGLYGKGIPLYARIICVADAYDAMSSARCYRAALDRDTILDELIKNSGTQFDPRIAAEMIKLIEEQNITRPEE